MRVLDLFSGIGGFSLGLERAGMETVAFCEYNKKAQLVLNKHWPDIPIYDDIRQLTGKRIAEEIGAIDLICGGFPCQPFSVAGKRGGEEDDRHLWPEYFRLIQEIRPYWVIGENVPGIIDMALDQVLSDLESEGYSCQTLIIPACAVNAAHTRDRVWIIANNEKQANREHNGKSKERQKQELRESISGNDVAYSKGQRIQRGGSVGVKISSVHVGQAISRGNGSGSGWDYWAVEPDVGRVAHGIPNRVDRLRQLGNAVVPQVVEVIGRAIMEIEN